MNKLPDDLYYHLIFPQLELPDIVAMSAVNKYFNRLAKDADNFIGRGCEKPLDIAPIVNFKDINAVKEIIYNIKRCYGWKYVKLYYNNFYGNLRDEDLYILAEVHTLDLRYCSGLTTIKPLLSDNSKVHYLNIYGCRGIQNITIIQDFPIIEQ